MKREKKSSSLKRIALAFLIPLAATFIFAGASYGKTNNSLSDGAKSIVTQQDPQPVNKDIPFVQVDEMPIFTGGDTAILNYIAKNTVYPEAAKKKGITGKVVVRFIVEKNCSVSEVTVLHSVNPEIDAEAVRVIKSLPKFEKPAKNAGVPVRCFYMLPITFSLN
jgi:periplasmic protein TonB